MYSSLFFVVAQLGVAPPSFGFISAGVELYVLTTTGDVMSVKSVMIVVVCALLSLLPVIFKRQLRAKIEWRWNSIVSKTRKKWETWSEGAFCNQRFIHNIIKGLLRSLDKFVTVMLEPPRDFFFFHFYFFQFKLHKREDEIVNFKWNKKKMGNSVQFFFLFTLVFLGLLGTVHFLRGRGGWWNFLKCH